MTNCIKHPTHLTIPTFMNRYFYNRSLLTLING